MLCLAGGTGTELEIKGTVLFEIWWVTHQGRVGAENEEKKLRGRIKKLEIATDPDTGQSDSKSKAVMISSRSAGTSSNRQGRKPARGAFPAPSLEMVQQAFQMLDPTGSGVLNPLALREVALVPALGSSKA